MSTDKTSGQSSPRGTHRPPALTEWNAHDTSSVHPRTGVPVSDIGTAVDGRDAVEILSVDPTWERLPLHPPPQALESQTSYFTRLVQANGMRDLQELTLFAGERCLVSRMRSAPDMVQLSTTGLQSLTGCSRAELDVLTLIPLSRRFGRSPALQSVNGFFAGLVVSHLRYCPKCLAETEQPYYSLLWRFTWLIGCSTHRCELLDRCGHCGASIPYIPVRSRMEKCPSCQRDLRQCLSPRLSDSLVRRVRRQAWDLQVLGGLSASPAVDQPISPYDQSWSHGLGSCYKVMRQRHHYSLQHVASCLSIDVRILLAIEMPGLPKKPTLHDYLRYADFLGHTVSSLRRSRIVHAAFPLESTSQAQVQAQIVDNFREALQHLLSTDERELPSLWQIARMIGVPVSQWPNTPNVRRLANAWRLLGDLMRARQRPHVGSDIADQVATTIQRLQREGKPLNQDAVARAVGRSRTYLRFFPEVEALLIPIACQSSPCGKPQSYFQNLVDRLQALCSDSAS